MPSKAFRPASYSASGVVGAFITEAGLDALNRALDAHGVSWRSHASRHGEAMPRMDSSQIITIFELPAPSIASALPARFQMLYRKA